MEVAVILGLVVLAYAVMQRSAAQGQRVLLTGPTGSTYTGSAQVAATLNRNAQLAQEQTALILGSGSYGPSETQKIAGASIAAGAGVGGGLAVGAAGVTGVAAGAATAGIGLIAAIGLGEWAAHTARVKGATAENEAINNIVPAFDADLKEIHDAYVGGQINATMAVTYLTSVQNNYWQYISQFAGRPGVAMRPCPSGQIGAPGSQQNGCTTGQPKCDKGCTSGCCVGCAFINASIINCIWAVQNQYHGPISICHIFAGKFGARDRPGYLMYW